MFQQNLANADKLRVKIGSTSIVFYLYFLAMVIAPFSSSFAGPSFTTYQAKIFRPDGYPMEVTSVNFKFTIMNPAGNCILFSETYSAVNTVNSGGFVSFALGSGVKTFPVSTPTTFRDVFSNMTASLDCETGGVNPTYSPLATDTRKLVVQFNDGAGWQTLPAMNINAVPYAMYASNAQSLNGKSDTAFVERTSLPSCASGEALFYDGTNFSCASSVNLVSTSAVTSALGYEPATSSSVVALNSTVASVSSTVNTISNSLTSLSNSTASSFAAITSSQWTTNGSDIHFSTGNVGIGTSTPVTALDVAGGVRISMESATCSVSYAGTLRYNLNAVEFCNGSTWTAFGISGAGLQSFNGSTSGTQILAVGSSGNSPAFNSVNGVHTLNIPLASAAGSVTAGLISNADYQNFSNKITSSAASVAQVLGYVPASASVLVNYVLKANNLSDLANVATARTNLGLGTFATASTIDLGSASATGTLAVARLPGLNGDVTTNAGSTTTTVAKLRGVTLSATAPSSGQILSFNGTQWQPTTNVSSQWTTSGATINYMTGSVGIGTVNPLSALDVSGSIRAKATTSGNGSFAGYNNLGVLTFSADHSSNSSYLRLFNSFASETVRISTYNSSWFNGGNVGIGTSSPAARLHLASGTTSLAPLKFVSGALLTSTQSGTMEFDGFDYYLTDGAGNRRVIATGSNASTIDDAAVITNSSGNITMYPNGGAGNVLVSATTASTNSSTGALVVKGGLGVAGDIFSSGAIVTSSNIQGVSVTATSGMVSPYIYGSTLANGNLRLESTTHATKGDVLIATQGGNVGIGTSSPAAVLHVEKSDNSALRVTRGGVINALLGDLGSTNHGQMNLYNASGTLGVLLSSGQDSYFTGGNVGVGTNNPQSIANYTIVDTRGASGAFYYFGTSSNVNRLGYNASTVALELQATTAVPITLHTSATERMRIDSSGNVGIGTNAPSAKFHVQDTFGGMFFDGTGTSYNRIKSTSTTAATGRDLMFTTQGGGTSPDLYIASSGNVGIGTSSPVATLNVSDGTANGHGLYGNGNMYSTAVGGANLGLLNRNTPTNGSALGLLSFGQGTVGASYPRAYIYSFATENWSGSTANGSRFDFYTTPNGSGTPNLRMTINHTGNVGIGATSPTAVLQLKAGTSTNGPLKLTSGTLLTSPQSGTIEYDGFEFYITDGNNIRRTIATATSTGALDNVSVVSSTAGITLWPAAGNSVVVSATTASTNSSTGALIVNGGIGVAGNIYSSGTIITSSNIQGASITATSGVSTTVIQGVPYLALNPNGGNVGIGTNTPVNKLHVTLDDANTNNLQRVAIFAHNTTGTPAAGIGSRIDLAAERSDGLISTAGFIGGVLTEVTAGQEDGDLVFGNVYNSGGTGTENMRLTSLGRLGIGTSSPAVALDVKTSTSTQYAKVAILANAIADGNFNLATKKGETTNANGEINAKLSFDYASTENASINFHRGSATTGGFLSFATNNGSERMRIDGSGNVGIGTSSPVRTLHVDGGATHSVLHITNTATGQSTTDGLDIFAEAAGTQAMIRNNESSPLVFGTSGTERVRIDASGNVGVGTTAPAAKLDVQGQIRPSMGTPLVNPGGNAVDFATGNTQYVTFSTCAGNALTVNLYSMLEGGSYSLIVVAPSNCLVDFTGISHPNGGSGGVAVTAFKYPAGQKFSSTGAPMVYSFLRANNFVFVAQVVDFQ